LATEDRLSNDLLQRLVNLPRNTLRVTTNVRVALAAKAAVLAKTTETSGVKYAITAVETQRATTFPSVKQVNFNRWPELSSWRNVKRE
jgi:hypothetical protein